MDIFIQSLDLVLVRKFDDQNLFWQCGFHKKGEKQKQIHFLWDR